MAHNKNFQQRQATDSNYWDNKKNTLKRQNEGDIWLKKISEGKKTVEELIPLIISEIEVKPIYYKHVAQICVHLDKIMKFFYRDLHVKALPLGSAATNLAIRNSDVDIFLDFGGNLPEPIPKLLMTLKNKVRKYGYFNKTIPIHARTPIVRSLHCSGISCDLSFTNALGVFNSQLIKFLISLDFRIRQVALILKHLMKKQGLLGPHAITSFALLVLILFFLQTLKNPLTPSINLLQNLAKERNFVVDWDVSFTRETNQLPTISNSMSVIELLQKFFQFYSTFEFGFYVICVYTGKSYLKNIFSDANLLPEDFHLYKRNLLEGKCDEFTYKKFMCVQDPFQHCANVTRNTTQKSVAQFQQLCYFYSNSGIDLLDNNVPEEKKMQYLINLIEEKTDKPQSKKIMLVEPLTIYIGQNLPFSDPNFSEDYVRKKWAEHTFKTVVEVLRKVMKCELVFKESEKASTSGENNEKIINCTLPHLELISKKRNEVKGEFEFPEDMPILNQEEIISNFICDNLLADLRKVSLKFEITCNVKKGPTCFCMQLNPLEQGKDRRATFPQIFKFIQNSLVKWVSQSDIFDSNCD